MLQQRLFKSPVHVGPRPQVPWQMGVPLRKAQADPISQQPPPPLVHEVWPVGQVSIWQMGVPLRKVQAAPILQQPPPPLVQEVAPAGQVSIWRMKSGAAVSGGAWPRRTY